MQTLKHAHTLHTRKVTKSFQDLKQIGSHLQRRIMKGSPRWSLRRKKGGGKRREQGNSRVHKPTGFKWISWEEQIFHSLSVSPKPSLSANKWRQIKWASSSTFPIFWVMASTGWKIQKVQYEELISKREGSSSESCYLEARSRLGK